VIGLNEDGNLIHDPTKQLIQELLKNLVDWTRRISPAWLVIVGQFFGSIALVAGFLGRIAAGGLFIIFTGALIVHLPDGWAMNWFGERKGEGIEYHVMLLSLLLIVIVRGSGAMSIDLWLTS
jgi:putative oxidoreductase